MMKMMLLVLHFLPEMEVNNYQRLQQLRLIRTKTKPEQYVFIMLFIHLFILQYMYCIKSFCCPKVTKAVPARILSNHMPIIPLPSCSSHAEGLDDCASIEVSGNPEG